MRKPHVEGRVKHYLARQFVSEYELPPRADFVMNVPDKVEQKLERTQGTVKFFDKGKGYGFCRRNGAMDVWFHHRALQRAGLDEVAMGDQLEFDLVPVPGKGGKAINIVKLNGVQSCG